MAHTDQIQFFKLVIDRFPNAFSEKVIDIGSNDINGGPHRYVNASEYIGVDLGPGENVDLVSKGEDVDYATGYFDVSMSSECFEHAPTWRAILINMIRMTRPGGLIVFSCATTGRPEHGTTRTDGGFAAPLAVSEGQEYYANVTPRQVRDVIGPTLLNDYFIEIRDRMFDLYFVGIKPETSPNDRSTLQDCRDAVHRKYSGRASYDSVADFAVNRGKRYFARVAGDSNLERARRVLYRS
jgi:SAM-dependent methyltransferase